MTISSRISDTSTNFDSLTQAIAQASKTAQLHLVGGFCVNLFEKYARQNGSFPQESGWTFEIKIEVATTQA